MTWVVTIDKKRTEKKSLLETIADKKTYFIHSHSFTIIHPLTHLNPSSFSFSIFLAKKNISKENIMNAMQYVALQG